MAQSLQSEMLSPLRRRVFNPHRLGDADLERSFIARRRTLEEIVRDVAAEAPGSHPQHHLISGQRGMGKTTLLLRVALELRRDPLRRRFIPLTFPEDQYVEVDRLSKFWLNCLDALADALEQEGGHADEVERIDGAVQAMDVPLADERGLEARSREAFAEAAERLGRRPVLLVDNFNILVTRLKADDYALRGFFGAAGAPIIVASSATAAAGFEDYGAAFYDAFRTRVLRPLSLDELRSVITELARESGRSVLLAQIPRETPRLAALRDLTGGNPRTAVLLFDLFSRGFSEDAFEDLDALLDTVTPLYQSRLDLLSDQAQVIVGCLARHWSPATAATLSALTRIHVSSISPQLSRLEEVGLVEKATVFPQKRAGYQLAERFLNIWYLMRFSTRRQGAGLASLTRFLQEFHTPARPDAHAVHEGSSRQYVAFVPPDAAGEAEGVVEAAIGRQETSQGADAHALSDALVAAYADNWGQAADALRRALAEAGFRLSPETRDDWFRASAVLLHLGYGGKWVSLLEAEGADVRMLPWFAAVSAHALGDRRYLGNAPAEARPAAEVIFDEIEERRSRLPARAQAAPPPTTRHAGFRRRRVQP